MFKINNISKILNFRNLEDNWNGNGSKKPDDYLIVDAIDFVRKFRFTSPEVFITSSNSIQFEWESDNGYLEYELSKNGIHMYETFKGKEINNRFITVKEYESIDKITYSILVKWI